VFVGAVGVASALASAYDGLAGTLCGILGEGGTACSSGALELVM
jgi:hypothetical protein